MQHNREELVKKHQSDVSQLLKQLQGINHKEFSDEVAILSNAIYYGEKPEKREPLSALAYKKEIIEEVKKYIERVNVYIHKLNEKEKEKEKDKDNSLFLKRKNDILSPEYKKLVSTIQFDSNLTNIIETAEKYLFILNDRISEAKGSSEEMFSESIDKSAVERIKKEKYDRLKALLAALHTTRLSSTELNSLKRKIEKSLAEYEKKENLNIRHRIRELKKASESKTLSIEESNSIREELIKLVRLFDKEIQKKEKEKLAQQEVIRKDINRELFLEIKNDLESEFNSESIESACKTALDNTENQCKIIQNTLSDIKENKKPTEFHKLSGLATLKESLAQAENELKKLKEFKENIKTAVAQEKNEETKKYLEERLKQIRLKIKRFEARNAKLKNADEIFKKTLFEIEEKGEIEQLLKALLDAGHDLTERKDASHKLSALEVIIKHVDVPLIQEKYKNIIQEKLREYQNIDEIEEEDSQVLAHLNHVKETFQSMLSSLEVTETYLSFPLFHEIKTPQDEIKNEKLSKDQVLGLHLKALQKYNKWIAKQEAYISNLENQRDKLKNNLKENTNEKTGIESQIALLNTTIEQQRKKITEIENLKNEIEKIKNQCMEKSNTLFKENGRLSLFLKNEKDHSNISINKKHIDQLTKLKKLIQLNGLSEAEIAKWNLAIDQEIENCNKKINELIVYNVKARISYCNSFINNEELLYDKKSEPYLSALIRAFKDALEIEIPQSLSEDQKREITALTDCAKAYTKSIETRLEFKKEIRAISGKITMDIDKDFQENSYNLSFDEKTNEWSLNYVNENKQVEKINQDNVRDEKKDSSSSTAQIIQSTPPPSPTLQKHIINLINQLPKKPYKEFTEDEKCTVKNIKTHVKVFSRKRQQSLSKEELMKLIRKKEDAIAKLKPMKMQLEAAHLFSDKEKGDLEKKQAEWVRTSKADYIDKTIEKLKKSKETLDLRLKVLQAESKKMASFTVAALSSEPPSRISPRSKFFRFFSHLLSMMPSTNIWGKRKGSEKKK